MLEKRRAERGKYETIESGRLPETHLHFRRMHVDVDHVRRHVERQKHDRLASG